MNILAVDTASSTLTLAVRTATGFEELSKQPQGMKHSEIIMPSITELCTDAGIKIQDLDLFICTKGPGSFTGLRIGMAAVKGLAFGLGKPVASVSTLEYHAKCILDFDGAVVSVIDARKNKFYLGVFECREGICSRIKEDIDGNAEDLIQALAPYERILVTGPDKSVFAPVLAACCPDKEITTQCYETVSPGTALIELGLEKFERQGADDIGQGPVYLRKSDAEIALEEKEKGEKNG